jgi:hypothetical protein
MPRCLLSAHSVEGEGRQSMSAPPPWPRLTPSATSSAAAAAAPGWKLLGTPE